MRYEENEWTFELEVPMPGKKEPETRAKVGETTLDYLQRMLLREDVRAREQDGRKNIIPSRLLYCLQTNGNATPLTSTAPVPVYYLPCGLALVRNTVSARLPFRFGEWRTLMAQEGDLLSMQEQGSAQIVYRPDWGCVAPYEDNLRPPRE